MASIEQERITPGAALGEPIGRGEPFPVGTTIARYRIVALLGSGAMGDVYRAHDNKLDREVALKVLPQELVHDRERVRRFAQEARAASALSHPHIVTIHEVGHARPSSNIHAIGERATRRGSEVHYISMEFVDGHTLRDTLTTSLPLRRAVELLAQVADGLGKAHAAGIIHRDLKPENIIVATEGYAKIVDFGLAKLIDADRGFNPIGADSPTLRALTQQGEVLGTPGYMAPEQITGRPIDPRADVFSFGCILYEAITHQRPFEAESFVDTLYKILHEDPPPVATFAPTAPQDLQRIVSKCLAKDREERYQSIRDAAIDLREWLHQIDPSSPAPRRNRSTQLRVALLATTLAVLPILGWLLLGRRDSSFVAPRDQQSIHRVTTNGRAIISAISPDARYVAYVTSDPKGSSLWIQQVETKSTLQLLPPAPGRYVALTFSRDGNYIYYVRYDDGMWGILNRIAILGGKPQPILRDIDTRASFSPDGTSVAFVRDDYNKSTSTVMVARIDGRGERALAKLLLPDRALSPTWSRDGNSIVVTQKSKLLEIAYPGGAVHEIVTKPRFDSLRGVTWSSDGESLIAAGSTENSTGHARLWSIDPQSGEGRALTDELSDVVAPSVSEDGKSIAAVQMIRQANLFQFDEHGVRPLTSGLGSANGLSGIAWLGNRLIYSSSSDGTSSIWGLDAAGGDATRLTPEGTDTSHPMTAADGSAIVYAVGTRGQSSIWRMRPDGSDRRQLTPGPRDSDFNISPDSKTLAWASIDEKSNAWNLWSMPLAGGPAMKLTTRPTLIEDIRFASDGQTVVFIGYSGNMLRLYRIARGGGEVTELTTKRSLDPDLSSDGRSIVCSYEFEDMYAAPAAMISLDGTNVVKLPMKGFRYRWHGRDISYLHIENGVTNLWLLTGEAPRKITDFTEGSIVDYAWSADGKRNAITHVVDSSDVVVITRK
jgi:serine/threonine protein kinase